MEKYYFLPILLVGFSLYGMSMAIPGVKPVSVGTPNAKIGNPNMPNAGSTAQQGYLGNGQQNEMSKSLDSYNGNQAGTQAQQGYQADYNKSGLGTQAQQGYQAGYNNGTNAQGGVPIHDFSEIVN